MSKRYTDHIKACVDITYTAVQKFGISKIFNAFFFKEKSLMLPSKKVIYLKYIYFILSIVQIY